MTSISMAAYASRIARPPMVTIATAPSKDAAGRVSRSQGNVITNPAGLDSDSLVPALKGQVERDQWKRRSPLYWECDEGRTAQAVRFGKWKAIRAPSCSFIASNEL